MKKSEIIFGTRPVLEALKAGREIEKIIIQVGLSSSIIKEIINQAGEKYVPFSFVPRQRINTIFLGNHQGVLCLLSAVRYADLDNLIAQSYQESRTPLLLLLDRITDVGNLGAIARTAECAGLDAIIVTGKHSAPLTGRAVKSSAGALSHIPVCRAQNAQKAMARLKESGLKIVACLETAEKTLYEIDMTTPLALIVGSEENGIQDSLLAEAHETVKIPTYGNIQSLNVSVAAGIALYEVIRQRKYGKASAS